MCNKFKATQALVILALSLHICASTEQDYRQSTQQQRSFLSDSGLSRTVHHVLNQCLDRDDIVWCFKVQGAKLLGRALKFQNINLLDGVSLIRKNDSEPRSGRSGQQTPDVGYLNNRDLENLSPKSLDSLLADRFLAFIKTRQLQVNMPRLLAFGKSNGQDLLNSMMSYVTSYLPAGLLDTQSGTLSLSNMFQELGRATSSEYWTAETDGNAEHSHEEGRKKKDDKKYLGPFVAAVILKTAILKMAYHSIAIIAGKALIVGKIALIISAIIGLKKLVSHDGGEKTTYEIVKHPQVQQSHTYSSSHAGEYEGGHEGGSYHRSIDDEMMMQDKAYNAWVPSTHANSA